MIGLLMLACATPEDSAGAPADSAAEAVTDYSVSYTVAPDPVVAGAESLFTFQIRDQLGRPIPDLQITHDRIAHVQFVSRDLASFQHLHEEDYASLSADDLRESTFRFPLTVPMAGEYTIVYDFAHYNQYLSRVDSLTATGTPEQAATPELTPNEVAGVDGLTGTLVWDTPAVPGHEASFHVHLEDTVGEVGPENDPIVQYLGADGHLFITTPDLDWTAHTHAWYPGMEDVPPGHTMPHVVDGPDLPFRLVLPSSGSYKMWLQLTRASDPTHVYVLPFVFVSAG